MTLMEKISQILDKKTLSPESIAKKHKCSVDHIMSQLEMGIKVEQEHTSNKKVAEKIALGHLVEDPYYYDKLAEMERKK